MVQYLQDLQGKGAAPLTRDEQLELQELRASHDELTSKHPKKAEESKLEKPKVIVDSSDSSDSEVRISLFYLTQ